MLTPRATRRNPPKVEASDSCFAGASSSAIFRPGVKSESNGAGILGSSCTASANAKNPKAAPKIAGKTKRTVKRLNTTANSTKSERAQYFRDAYAEPLRGDRRR